MKKIFYFIASAVVALGATACQNDINDNITPEGQESLSIEVEISESTRIALGDLEEGKRQLYFEDGDRLLVTTAWGGDATNPENNFWFTYSSATGKFTCTAEGVGALKGQSRDVFHLVEDPVNGLGTGVLCDSEAGLDGVVMVGSTSALGESKIVMDVYPVLKYSSEHSVTFTTSKSVFGAVKSWGIGQYKEYTFPAGTDVYVPLFSSGEITLSATIKGEVIKSKTINFEKNKIYNLGTLEAKPEESVEGDPAGLEIAIDGVFTDWDAITTNVVTVADDAEYGDITVLKAYADKDNVYVYASVKSYDATYSHMSILLDLDNDNGTGGGHWFPGNFAEVFVENGYLRSNSGSVKTFTNDSYSEWDSASNALVSATATYTAKVVLNGTNLDVEVAFPRASFDAHIKTPNIGVCVYSLTAWAPSGILPAEGTLVIPVYNE